ncbi:MAG: regulatory protein RecX [Pseudomonadales bacterium]|nr:regulatory protein RecX [Pseudomonadales bacterium]
MVLVETPASDTLSANAGSAYTGVGETAKAIRRSAMDLLARREHGTVELQRKLLKKFADYSLVDHELSRLVDEGLLSDARFVEAYIRYRAKAGFGPVKILVELRERGVRDELSKKNIYAGTFDWVACARQARDKKFGLERDYNHLDSQERARQMRFLAYRGFSSEQVAELF